MRKFRAKTSIIIATVALALTLSFCLVGCSKTDVPPASKAESIVTIEIYPNIELILDQYQTVIAAHANNFDAEILLYNSAQIVGKNINTAIDGIAELSVNMEYLSTSNSGNTISVSVSSSSENTATALYNTVKTRFENTLKRQNVTATVLRAIDFTMRSELNKIKSDLKNFGKKEYGVELTQERYKLVKSALAADVYMTLNDAVKLSDTALITLIQQAAPTRLQTLPKAYATEYQKIQNSYDTLEQYLLDMPYITAYTDSGKRTNYGAVFSTYRAARCSINQGYISLLETYSNPQIKEATALDILVKLGIAQSITPEIRAKITEDKTANGKITKNGLSNYINFCYRNANGYRQDVMNASVSYMQPVFDTLASEAAKTDASLKETVVKQINAIDGIYKNIYDDVLAEIGVDIYNWKSETVFDIYAILTELSQKIEKVFSIMMSDLTEKELNAVVRGKADNKITLGDVTRDYLPKMDALALKWQGVLQTWQDKLL